MKKLNLRLTLSVAVLALSTAASAATTSGTVSFSGTLVAPVTCSLSAPSNVNLGTITNSNAVITAPFTVGVTCSSGAPWTLSAPANTPVTIGPDTDYLSIFTTGGGATNINTTPYPGTGNGALQSNNLNVVLHGATESTPIPSSSLGAFSASVTLTLAY